MKAKALKRAKYLLEMLGDARKSINDHSLNHTEVCILRGKASRIGLPQFDNLDRICRDVIAAIDEIKGEDEAKKLMEELGLDWEYDGNVFRINVIEYPNISPVLINPGSVFMLGETIWSKLIDILEENKAKKYSFLNGHTICDCCFGCGDIAREDCTECNGTGYIKL